MKRAKFTLEYRMDDGWYVGRVRELPAVMRQGETLEELEDNIRDAYEMLQGPAAPAPRRKIRTKDSVLGFA